MPDLVDRLAYQVASRIRELGFDEPNRRVVGILLEIAYLGTLRSEEGRFVKGSLTFANPKRPDVEPPFIRRADYPAFTKFESPEILTVQTLVKLARAVDRWSGSIAVYATRRYEIVAWGVVDQLVQQNVRWHREADAGFANPGLLTVTMDGIGDISAYHGDLFLGGLKAQALVTRENNALVSKIVFEYGSNALAPFATAIARVLDDDEREAEILEDLFRMWVTSIARLCIGLRQRGTGGAFLLTPKPIKRMLQVRHPFAYPRLRDSTILHVLDEKYSSDVEHAERAFANKAAPVPANLVLEARLAETDAREYGSRPHIQGGGLKPESLARWNRAATDPPPKGAPGRPNCRDRSPVFPVLLQFLHEIAEGHDRLARRRAAASKHGGRQPARPHRLGQQRIGEKRAAARLRWHDFRDHAVAANHKHDLTAGSKTDVFAEPVLERLEANRAHSKICDLWLPEVTFVNPARRCSPQFRPVHAIGPLFVRRKQLFDSFHHRPLNVRLTVPHKLLRIRLELPNIDDHVVALAAVIAAQPNRDMLRVSDFEKDVLLAGDFRHVHHYLRLGRGHRKSGEHNTWQYVFWHFDRSFAPMLNA